MFYSGPAADMKSGLPGVCEGTSVGTPLWASLMARIDTIFHDQGLPNADEAKYGRHRSVARRIAARRRSGASGLCSTPCPASDRSRSRSGDVSPVMMRAGTR